MSLTIQTQSVEFTKDGEMSFIFWGDPLITSLPLWGQAGAELLTEMQLN
jgi:hypothetical protein